jgi:hypothetical protein
LACRAALSSRSAMIAASSRPGWSATHPRNETKSLITSSSADTRSGSAKCCASRYRSTPDSVCSISPVGMATPPSPPRAVVPWCRGLDLAAEPIIQARQRAVSEHVDIDWREGDVEQLPFVDATFDVVLSTFGIVFAPWPAVAAAEAARVLRSGGTFGVGNFDADADIQVDLAAVLGEVHTSATAEPMALRPRRPKPPRRRLRDARPAVRYLQVIATRT